MPLKVASELAARLMLPAFMATLLPWPDSATVSLVPLAMTASTLPVMDKAALFPEDVTVALLPV